MPLVCYASGGRKPVSMKVWPRFTELAGGAPGVLGIVIHTCWIEYGIYIYFINDCWLSTIPVHTRKKMKKASTKPVMKCQGLQIFESWSSIRPKQAWFYRVCTIYIIYYLFGLWWTTYIGKYNQTHSNTHSQYQIYTRHKYIYNIVLIMYLISLYRKIRYMDKHRCANIPNMHDPRCYTNFFCSLPSHDWAFKQ
jgi:hypothetical protein